MNFVVIFIYLLDVARQLGMLGHVGHGVIGLKSIRFRQAEVLLDVQGLELGAHVPAQVSALCVASVIVFSCHARAFAEPATPAFANIRAFSVRR